MGGLKINAGSDVRHLQGGADLAGTYAAASAGSDGGPSLVGAGAGLTAGDETYRPPFCAVSAYCWQIQWLYEV
jgi:hypothetical protein